MNGRHIACNDSLMQGQCGNEPGPAAPSRLTDRSARAASTWRCAEVRPATRRCSLSSQAAWDTSLPFDQGGC